MFSSLPDSLNFFTRRDDAYRPLVPAISLKGDEEKLLGSQISPPPSSEFLDQTERPKSVWSKQPVRWALIALLCLAVVSLLYAIFAALLASTRPLVAISYLSDTSDAATLVADNKLPQDPAPIVLAGKDGELKWTVSIPPSLSFPLAPQTYASICMQSHAMSNNLLKMKSNGMHGHGHFPYDRVDKNFIDVQEAEEIGVIPTGRAKSWMGYTSTSESGMKACEKSLTYVLETEDAGFGSTLMGLWMAYGLAQKEGRAFFLDDRTWAYGKYTTYFLPPPAQGCLAPPDHHRLPCPHHTSHLLVSSATTYWTFGHQFEEAYEDPRGVEVRRQKNIFALLRAGHDALFRLPPADATYLATRTAAIRSSVRDQDGLTIGIHIKHGATHPYEFAFRKSYLPLSRYVDTADALTASNGTEGTLREMHSKILLASDDPDVFAEPALAHAVRAQDHIVLDTGSASVPAPATEVSPAWPGGFDDAAFLALGEEEARRRRDEPIYLAPSAKALRLRALVGRAYVLDLAVLGTADRVVCGVRSIGCRLLAVMMGWDEGIVRQGWRNVDGDFDWKGIVW